MNAAVDAANVQSPVKPRPRRWRWILILAGPLLIAAVVAVTCSARFYRLDHPAGITFDELHFGKFVLWGMNQWFYLCVEESLALPRAGAVFRYLSTPHPFYHLAHSPHPAPPPFPPLRFSQ